MNQDRATEQVISDWLVSHAPYELDELVLGATFERTRRMHQVRRGPGWRLVDMHRFIAVAAGAAAIAVVIVGAALLLRPPARQVGSADVSFTSAQYGYTVRIPSSWRVTPATEPWQGGDGLDGPDTAFDDTFHLDVSPAPDPVRVKAMTLPAGTTGAAWLADWQHRDQAGRCFGTVATPWSDAIVGGHAARMFGWRCDQPNPGADYDEYAFAAGGTGFVITGSPSMIQAIVDSFQSPASASTATPSATASAISSAAGPQAVFTVHNDGGPPLFAFGSIWIGDDTGVQRIDPATNHATMIPVPGGPVGWLRANGSTVFATDEGGKLGIDPKTNKVQTNPDRDTMFLGWDWAIGSDGTLSRLDPGNGKASASVSVQGPVSWSPGLAFDFGSIWVAEGDTHEVVRVDPAGPTIVTRITGFATDDSLLTIGSAFGSIWVQANAANRSGILYRVDPNTNRIIATIDVGDPTSSDGYGGADIAFSDNAVWTADSSPTITRVDPATDTVVSVRSIDLHQPEWIAYGADSLWVRNQSTSAVERYDAAAWGP